MDEFCRLATKYALCQDQLPEGVPTLKELKERFAMFDWCKDKASAAAFGYYAALEEFNGKEEKEDDKSIIDNVRVALGHAQDTLEDPMDTMEVIMGIVYTWLIEELDKSYATTFEDIWMEEFLKELFSPYVRPGVIS